METAPQVSRRRLASTSRVRLAGPVLPPRLRSELKTPVRRVPSCETYAAELLCREFSCEMPQFTSFETVLRGKARKPSIAKGALAILSTALWRAITRGRDHTWDLADGAGQQPIGFRIRSLQSIPKRGYSHCGRLGPSDGIAH